MRLLDPKESGFINEDEQILIFSIVKERMQVMSNVLCNIHEYSLSKQILDSVKILKNNINEIFRTRAYQKELEKYNQMRINKIESFENHWKLAFYNSSQACDQKKAELIETQQKELKDLEKNLNTQPIK